MSLWSKKIEGAGGTLAEPGGFDHYLAVLPQVDLPSGVGWGGYSNPGDTVSSTGSALIVVDSRDPGRDGMWATGAPTRDLNGTLFSANTLAHELGHNYGRMHVAGCASPSFTDPGYPYAGGTMSDAASGHLGFNAYNRKLLPLLGTGDIMSYCLNRWASDYTWGIIYHRLATGYGPVLGAERRPRDGETPTGYTCGLIDLADKKSSMRPVLALGAAERARALAALPAPGGRYVLRAFQGAVLVATFPTGVAGHAHDAGDDIPDGFAAWASLTNGLAGIDRLELHDQQAPLGSPPLATRSGGGAAPVVTVTQPTAAGPGSGSELLVQWTSTDDGPGPLAHFVRLSLDDGSTWRSLASELAGNSLAVPLADIPGGALCRIEVIASDGILCGRGLSERFSLPDRAPESAIFFENERRHIPDRLATAVFDYGERLVAHAEVSDSEDGWLPDSSLAWKLFTTPPILGTGRTFQPTDLPPGTYLLELSATDSLEQTTTAKAQVVVRPPFVEEASVPIVIDGFAEDAGYAADRRPKTLRYPGSSAVAQIRFVNDGGSLCLSASGLPTSGLPGERFTLLLDVGSVPPFQPSYSSLRIEIARDGMATLRRGMDSEWGDEGTEALAINTSTSSSGATWNLEVRLPGTMFFNGFTGSMVRLALLHSGAHAADSVAALPTGASLDVPTSWMPVVLGGDWESLDDLDNDDLPDAWEKSFFGPGGSPGGTADSDGDGASDAAEYAAGTSPMDVSSYFSLRLLTGPGPAPVIGWSALPDRSYSVWRSIDLVQYELVAEGLDASISSEQTWTDPNPPTGRAFYRVMAHLPR